MTTIISKDRVSRMMDAIASVLERADQILAGPGVKISYRHWRAGAPAWSIGSDIYLNSSYLDDTLRKVSDPRVTEYGMEQLLLELKGLNYHELCHVLFSPSYTSLVSRRINESGRCHAQAAFNLLEDQRIETLFTTMYRMSKSYFRYIVALHLLKSAVDPRTYLLLAGRLFVSKETRAQYRAAFAAEYGADLADTARRIIREYLLIDPNVSPDKAYRLVMQMIDVLEELERRSRDQRLPTVMVKACDTVSVSLGRNNTPTSGNPVTSTRVRISRKKVRDAIESLREEIDEAMMEDDAESADGPGDPTGEEGTGDQQADGSGTPNAGGSGAGSDGHKDPSDLGSSVDNPMTREMEDVLGDESVRTDIEADVTAVRREMDAPVDVNLRNGEVVTARTVEEPPSADALIMQRRVAAELDRLCADSESEWLRDQHVGRLNARRVMWRRPTDVEIFDRWDDGLEGEAMIEAVICVDTSGSMNFQTQQLSECLWALKRSFDRSQMPVTVLSFSTLTHLVYARGERANMMKQLTASGGTNASTAIEQAASILKTSECANRALFILTDGEWSDRETADRLITEANANGVHTVLLGIGRAVERFGDHGCRVAVDVNSPSDMAMFVRSFVSQVNRAVTSRR